MLDYFQREKERLEKMQADIQRDIDRQEQRAECQKMIDDAIRQYDQQLMLDIQMTLNGTHVSMNSLANEIRKKLIYEMQKAFK